MSKQDRTRARTAAEIEQKYNFGQTFAEVYNLITDAQKAAEEAQKAVDSLDHEQIFNLLTDNGKIKGVYRGDDGDVYINATYIKSGKLSAEYIDAENLTVKASNIDGEITSDKLSEDLREQISKSAATTEEYLRSIGITTIDGEGVKSPKIEGGQILGAEIYGGVFSDLAANNYLRMQSTVETEGEVPYLSHLMTHYVGDASSSVPLTTMGWVSVEGVAQWVLSVLGSTILSRLSTGLVKAHGYWDFTDATVYGL